MSASEQVNGFEELCGSPSENRSYVYSIADDITVLRMKLRAGTLRTGAIDPHQFSLNPRKRSLYAFVINIDGRKLLIDVQ